MVRFLLLVVRLPDTILYMRHWFHLSVSPNGWDLLFVVVVFFFGIAACVDGLHSIIAELAAIRGELERLSSEVCALKPREQPPVERF